MQNTYHRSSREFIVHEYDSYGFHLEIQDSTSDGFSSSTDSSVLPCRSSLHVVSGVQRGANGTPAPGIQGRVASTE